MVVSVLLASSMRPLGTTLFLSLLNASALGLFAFVAWQWMLVGRRKWAILFAAVLTTVGTACVFLFFDPALIPIDAITPLQEGRSAKNVQQLYGTAAHAGANHRFLVHLFADGAIDLRDTVRMNLWLSGLNVLFFWVVAHHVLKQWWMALLLTGLLLSNPLAFHVALSGQSAAAIGLYLLMLVAAAGLLGRRKDVSAPAFVASFALIATVTVLLGHTRLEIALFGLVALAAAWLRMRVGDEELLLLARAELRRISALILSRWFWVFAAVLLALWRLNPTTASVRWARAMLHPFNLTFLTLPNQLLNLFFPLTFVFLFLLGLWHVTRNWQTFLLLPVSLIGLYKAFYSAACNDYELFRYLSYLFMPMAFTALFGCRESMYLAAKLRFDRHWPRVAVVLLVFSQGAMTLKGQHQHVFLKFGVSEATYQFPISRDLQKEVRFLLRAKEKYPQCLFVARVASKDRMERPGEELKYKYLLFGGGLPHAMAVPDAATLDEALSVAPPSSCAFLYRSLDCNFAHSNGCEDVFQGRIATEELVFARSHYNNVLERGMTFPVVRLQLFALKPSNQMDSPTDDPTSARQDNEQYEPVTHLAAGG